MNTAIKRRRKTKSAQIQDSLAYPVINTQIRIQKFRYDC